MFCKGVQSFLKSLLKNAKKVSKSLKIAEKSNLSNSKAAFRCRNLENELLSRFNGFRMQVRQPKLILNGSFRFFEFVGEFQSKNELKKVRNSNF